MPENRYFFDGTLSQSVILEGTEQRHLTQVMRRKPGDTVELVNGKGQLAQGVIVETKKKETIIEIQSIDESPHPSAELILAQAIPRMNRLDTLIEKCTELGATQFWLFPGERSERKKLTDHQLERLHHITVAALKQSGRLWLPQIKTLPSIPDWKKPQYPILFGDVDAATPILHVKKEQGNVLVIGPESGLSTDEINSLKELGGTSVLLHKNILRTDTAAICGIAMLYYSTTPL